MNETRDILTLAVEIGAAMLQNGGEITAWKIPL